MTPSQSADATLVHARIHPRALDHMPLFFDATAPTVFVELIQNARRAGADRVDIITERADCGPGNDAVNVAVWDNGRGIADPAVLLSFGESDWAGDVSRRERAAGMGLACLARRGCTVTSRAKTPSSQPATGWRMMLEPDHFLGKTAAIAVPHTMAPEPCGTCVTFHAAESLDALRAAAAAAARYAPLSVSFNGAELVSSDFLEGALHREDCNGVTLGVIRSRQPLYNEPDLNFHGLTLNVRLPHVQSLDGETWTVRADVADCPELELVLPARKEAVENAFLEKLRDEALLAIYRALAAMDPPPRFAYKDHSRAANAGICLPVPPAKLRPWQPGKADVDNWTLDSRLMSVGPGSLVVEYDADPPDTQTFHRAACRAKLAPMLFEPDRRLAGYSWYDRLLRVTDVNAQIDIDGATYTQQALHRKFREARNGDGAFDPGDRAERIAMTVDIAHPDGRRYSRRYLADIVFLDTEYGVLGDACPVIAADSDIGAEDLAQLLRRAYFCPSDDSDADSYETQSNQFDDAALHLALKHVATADEATRAAIAQAVWREIHWLMPRNRQVDITVRGNRIDVALGSPAQNDRECDSPSRKAES